MGDPQGGKRVRHCVDDLERVSTLPVNQRLAGFASRGSVDDESVV